jgi:hypothetical protein
VLLDSAEGRKRLGSPSEAEPPVAGNLSHAEEESEVVEEDYYYEEGENPSQKLSNEKPGAHHKKHKQQFVVYNQQHVDA